MNTFDFASKQLELIELEKNAEIDEIKTLLSTCSLQRLQLKGQCLLKLKIDHKYTGLYGRTIIVLQSAIFGKVINTQHFSSGDIVSISENSVAPSQLSDDKSVLSGTVTKVTASSVSVAIDSDIENVMDQLSELGTYKIIKLCNDISHKRIKGALMALKEGRMSTRTAHLADILFMQATPGRSNWNVAKASSDADGEGFKFFNARLDLSQQEAVMFTFEQSDLAIIHGPPGTGKTTTLVEIIKQNCLKYKQRILCCAPSNIAVDNLVERLVGLETGYARLKLIRLGHPARLLEHIQDYSLDSVLMRSDQYKLASDVKVEMEDTLKKIRKSSTQRGEREGLKREMRELRKELYAREERASKEVLRGADIILATLTTAHADGPLKHLADDHFDIIIIDECSQAMEAACWIPLIKGARKLIIAGDHLQLPPTIISKEAARKGLEITLMKRLIDSLGVQSTRMLTIQYRMHELIMNWISAQLYESRLVAHASVAKHLLSDLSGVRADENTLKPLVLIDTDGCDMAEMVADSDGGAMDEESKANDGEANIVCRHVCDLIKQGVRQEEIAVITPYNLQMELIRAKLHTRYPKVEVKSVDGFQGREKEAVVISLVRSNTRGEVGFLSDFRRINVAISRARRHLCVVCDSQTCKTDAFLKSFLDYCNEHADIRSAFDYVIEESECATGIDLGFGEIKFQKLKIAEKKSDVKKQPSGASKVPQRRNKEPTAKIAAPVSIETDEEKVFQQQVIDVIRQLQVEPSREHSFPCDLNSRQRRIVHELAEAHHMQHLSRGEADKRYITLSVQPIRPIVNEKVNVEEEPVDEEEVVETNDAQTEILEDDSAVTPKNSESKQTKKKPAKKEPSAKSEKDANKPLLLGEIEDQTDANLQWRNDCRLCPLCTKFILKSNYAMHELHCAKVNTAPQPSISTIRDTEAAANPPTPPSKLKKNPIESADPNDFDALIDMMQKTNSVCNYQGCKAKVTVLGQTCEFCRNRFCFTHSLEEVHGCGDEAKKKARTHIRKTGNLDVNERQPTNAQKLQHKYVEKKLHAKIEAMAAARTGTDKKKEKK